MKFALINPNWHFEGSVYFGCREPHFPLEYGYSKALLEGAGHDAEIIDAQLEGLTLGEIRRRVSRIGPDISVITSAPSYLFWRCAPPDLRVPQEVIGAIRGCAGAIVAVGPHSSTTPRAALRKLDAMAVILGECEEILPRLAGDWDSVSSICYWRNGEPHVEGAPHSSNLMRLPALRWTADWVRRHRHHHHRFDAQPRGPGAEIEASRGCPYKCTFCAKENFRNQYRRRPLNAILDELDALIAQGTEYVYFIDEIFLPNHDLLEALAERPIRFGMQTRIDLWNEETIRMLGRAGCVSIEAGVESISEAGREWLDKKCRIGTRELADRLAYAKQWVPFVQANLIEMRQDDAEAVQAWRRYMIDRGVWANQPVPLFPYPGSPDYTRLWGAPDDLAWERAHEFYLNSYAAFSDIQDHHPVPLVQLESIAR